MTWRSGSWDVSVVSQVTVAELTSTGLTGR